MSIWKALSFCCSIGVIAVSGARAEPVHTQLKTSLGYHFSSGTYGSSDRTDIAYVPLTVRGEIDLWTVKLTVPYLRISGPPGLVEGPAGPIATDDGESDGLGDIILRASYTFLPLTNWMPFFELVGKVKFPTADEDDGLGTGEFDYTVQGEVARSFGKFTPFGMLGYRFLGKPSDADLNDVFLGSVGALYQFLDLVSAGLFLDYREASSSSSDDLLDLVPYLDWKVTTHWSASVYVSAGLLEGSPDVGTGLEITRTW